MSWVTDRMRRNRVVEEADWVVANVAALLTDKHQAVLARAFAHSAEDDIFDTLQEASPPEAQRWGVILVQSLSEGQTINDIMPGIALALGRLAASGNRLTPAEAIAALERAGATPDEASDFVEGISDVFERMDGAISLGTLAYMVARTPAGRSMLISLFSLHPAGRAARYVVPIVTGIASLIGAAADDDTRRWLSEIVTPGGSGAGNPPETGSGSGPTPLLPE